jgi:hypothetical protein
VGFRYLASHDAFLGMADLTSGLWQPARYSGMQCAQSSWNEAEEKVGEAKAAWRRSIVTQ